MPVARPGRRRSLGALLLGFAALGAGSLWGGEHTLREWRFDREGDWEDWQPNAQVAGGRVAGGWLSCQSSGSDPILEYQGALDVPASPWQAIQIRLRADRDGVGEFFWSNTAQGRYGGFTQEKSTRFPVRGDRAWHTYRLWPFWHPEGRIVRLRFDPYAGASFDVDFIRIVERETPGAATAPDFDFAGTAAGWQSLMGSTLTPGRDGLGVSGGPDGEGILLLGPPMNLEASQFDSASLRLSTTLGPHASLVFVSGKQHGLQSLGIPLEPDGQEHTYVVDLLAAPAWRERVLAVGLRFPVPPPGTRDTQGLRLCWLKLGDVPKGPAELRVQSVALEEALPRTGRPAILSARLTHLGGEIASNVVAALELPPGVDLAPASHRQARLATIGYGEEPTVSWTVHARRPVRGRATVRVTADRTRGVTRSNEIGFSAPPAVARSGYVPEPKPVRGPYEAGVYYFPGWKSASQWAPVQRFPERRPVLGWYREGDPEVADWHIKWAVEHGVTFFAYDWYWSQGARQLEHALHEGYFQARYRRLLKYCLLWANHNPPGTSSRADCQAVTRFWIEHYFRMPEYFTLQRRPLVIVFSPDRLTADLGGQVRSCLEAMREECRAAGLPPVYLAACVGDAGQGRAVAAEGYDAVTAYTWPGLGAPAGENYAPFETILEGYRRTWAGLLEQCPVPLLVPVCGGWDSRPWHGDNNLVRYGRTPELFARHVRDARAFLDRNGARTPPGESTNRPAPVVLIEAWNEWGEGSYLEPHQEFGFGYLDALRRVLTTAPVEHSDLAPADVGLGPYEVPPAEPGRSAWSFRAGDDGWSNSMGIADLRAHDGYLEGRTSTPDPALFSPPLQARASAFSRVALRLRLTRTDGQPFRDSAQLFWQTRQWPESEASSVRFEVTGDGQWHDYQIPLTGERHWRGIVTRLRLDPCSQVDVRVHLSDLRLEP